MYVFLELQIEIVDNLELSATLLSSELGQRVIAPP